MALTIKTYRMLWGRAASKCSMPECRQELILDPLDTDEPSLVGEAAHVVAEQPNGPPGHSNLTLEQRNRYANLILLCNVHHKQVDDQVTDFTVERLKRIKQEHETWVRTTLAGFDKIKQADDERWAGYIEEWALRAGLNIWIDQTNSFLQATRVLVRIFSADSWRFKSGFFHVFGRPGIRICDQQLRISAWL